MSLLGAPPGLGSPGGSDGKESACNARDLGSIPGSGRSPGGANGNPLHILAWRIPWTEEPDGLESMGSQRVRHNWATNTSTFTFHLVCGNICKPLLAQLPMAEKVQGLGAIVAPGAPGPLAKQTRVGLCWWEDDEILSNTLGDPLAGTGGNLCE